MNKPLSHGNLVTKIKDGLAITTTRDGSHVSTVRAGVSSPVAAAAGVRANATRLKQSGALSSTSSRTTARTKADPMPFTALMKGAPAPALAPSRTSAASPEEIRYETLGETQRWPEMSAHGIATGRFVEMRVPTVTAPKIDATALAKRILAAGRKARGEK